jgi:serine/threonine protein kinase
MPPFSDDEIVLLCNSSTTVLSAPQCSNSVVRIPNSLAVKFGHYVTSQEFKNQQVAQQRLDPKVVTVPKAYRFFKKDGVGYIVMDYVEGYTLDLKSVNGLLPTLGKVLNHIHSKQKTEPGSLGGGPVSGTLWPEHEEVEFSDSNDLQVWFEGHSRSSPANLDLDCHTLSMCHLDFTLRNIMTDGDRIYLIDWASAGYFPRFFEQVSYEFLPHDLPFFNRLKPYLAPLSDRELNSAKAVLETLQYSQIRIL